MESGLKYKTFKELRSAYTTGEIPQELKLIICPDEVFLYHPDDMDMISFSCTPFELLQELLPFFDIPHEVINYNKE